MKKSVLVRLLVMLIIVLASCVKEEDLIRGRFEVLDEEARPQFGARVAIYHMEYGPILISTGNANPAGVYYYLFTGPGKYKVTATRIDSTIISSTNQAFAEVFCGEVEFELTDETEVSHTIVLRNCD